MTDLDDMFALDEQGVENKIDVERAMGRLSYREAAVLYLWVTGYTQEEIGEAMGCDQSTVSRVLAKMHKSSEKWRV